MGVYGERVCEEGEKEEARTGGEEGIGEARRRARITLQMKGRE